MSNSSTRYHLPMSNSFIEIQWTNKHTHTQTNKQTRAPLGKGDSHTEAKCISNAL